jgi:hypothetical protein
MPFIKKGAPLEDWQTDRPITLLEIIRLPNLFLDAFIDKEYGDRSGVKAINYNRKNKSAPYFVCCRGAWKMHTDPGYNRYAHHIVLKSCNAKLTGYLDDYEVVNVGQTLIIDSHSPHALMPIRSKEEVFFLSLAQDLTTKNINFIDSLNLNEYLLPLRRS